MISVVILDTTPLGLITQRTGKPAANACRTWAASLDEAGVRIYVPEIADYEVRRELCRANQTEGIERLDALKVLFPGCFLPLTTPAMRLAADLWADVRNAGLATADRHALDGDVILCAQALSLGMDPAEIVVATSNVGHIRRFLNAEEWQNITP